MATPAFWGPKFLVNTTTSGDQQDVTLHALKDGAFVAVWEDSSHTGGDTSGTAIRGQIFNADGTKRGGEFLINTVTAGNQLKPHVTVLNDGRFVVAWADAAQGQVYARAFSASGSALGSDFQVSTTGGYLPSVTALSNGGFAIAYVNVAGDGIVQAFGPSLQQLGGGVTVNAASANLSLFPDVVAMQGRYAVFFEDWDETGGSPGAIAAQIFSNDGTAMTGPIVIAAEGTNKKVFNPVAATLTGGRTVVAWIERINDPRGIDITSIKAQILNPDGSKFGGEIVVNSGGVSDELSEFAITQLADGGFAVAYFTEESGRNTDHLYLATFNSNGVRSQTDLLVDRVYSLYLDCSPSLTTLEDGRVVVSWGNPVTERDDYGNALHGQIVDPRLKGVNVKGSALNDHYIGSRFNDRLSGGSGNDRLDGGEGKDIYRGGSGKDAFIFRDAPKKSNKDKIVDFKVKDDSIWLDNAVFTKLGKKGSDAKPAKLKKDFFTIGDKAKDKNDYLIYDSKKGVLYYDDDGSGSHKAVAITTLSKKLKMTHKDFFVI